MKNMLRIVSLTLAALALTLCLVACGGGSSSAGLIFKANGVDVVIGAPADGIIEGLGNWNQMNSSDSCGGFQGKDYIYTYGGFRVSTTPAKDGNIVCKVELTDDSVKTPEGLYIGMTRADAEAAMKGFSSEAVGDNLVYSTEGVKLQVIFRDGAVSGIIYVAE